MSPLVKRCLSAIVLAPPVLIAIFFGPPYSDILVVLLCALAAWEWARICSGERRDIAFVVAVGALPLVPALAAFGHWQAAGLALLAATLLSFLLACSVDRARAAWLGFGVAYVGLFCLAFQSIREYGWQPVFWLLLVVWATDTGAYFAGRAIGGPKLAPRISPNKTWAGLIGGMVAAAAITLLLSLGTRETTISPEAAIVAMVLAVVAQIGDLLESHYKRCHGVKDSSNLIPGHGGILDRIDGLMAAALAVFVILLIEKGSWG